MSARKQKKKSFKASKPKQNEVQYPTSATEKSEKAVEPHPNKTDKNMPDLPCNEVLAFPETDNVSPFKNK